MIEPLLGRIGPSENRDFRRREGRLGKTEARPCKTSRTIGGISRVGMALASLN